MRLHTFLVFLLCAMPTFGVDFKFPAKCNEVWGPFISSMVRSGFHPTQATNKDAGIVVMDYRSGAGANVDKAYVREYTTELPGAITTYQIFGIQQAAATFVDAAQDACKVTMGIDFVAYKTSFLQTGWIKLISNGTMESELLRPILKQFEDKALTEQKVLNSFVCNLKITFDNPRQCPVRCVAAPIVGLVSLPDCSFLKAVPALFCSQCGAAVEGMNFCSRCGHRVQ